MFSSPEDSEETLEKLKMNLAGEKLSEGKLGQFAIKQEEFLVGPLFFHLLCMRSLLCWLLKFCQKAERQ